MLKRLNRKRNEFRKISLIPCHGKMVKIILFGRHRRDDKSLPSRIPLSRRADVTAARARARAPDRRVRVVAAAGRGRTRRADTAAVSPSYTRWPSLSDRRRGDDDVQPPRPLKSLARACPPALRCARAAPQQLATDDDTTPNRPYFVVVDFETIISTANFV